MTRTTPTRRLALSFAVVAVVLSSVPHPGASPAQADVPVGGSPNVILMVVDDATVEDIKHMPNVQALLSDQGTTFARNYSPFPLCCPARSTILTGQYAHNHHVLDNVPPLGGAPAFDGTNTIATYLTSTYRTGLIGKYLNGLNSDTFIPPGWDDWRSPINGTTYNYVHQEQNVNGTLKVFDQYMPDKYGAQDRAFIRGTPLGQPYFSYLAWVAPHSGTPHESAGDPSSPYVKAEYRGTYQGPRLPNAASLNEADVRDKRLYVRNKPLLADETIDRIKNQLVQRRESLMAVDEQVAKIVGTVAERGDLNNTYFIFVSDNGFMQGQHRFGCCKEQAYEPSSRVPLIIRGPAFPAGLRYQDVTGLQDLTPTILDITNQPLPAGAPAPDGVSLHGLVDGSVVTDRAQLIEVANTVLMTDQQVDAGQRVSKARAQQLITEGVSWNAQGVVTSDRWKYIEYPTTNEGEMYNLDTDPDELVNLYNWAGYAAQRARLAELLVKYKDCSGMTCRQ